MKIGVLTGGGDCPGLNAVIRALTRSAISTHGAEVVGFYDAWDGVMDDRAIPLTVDAVRGTLPRGGTILGTRRGGPYDHADGVRRVKETLQVRGLDALVVIGGNGSLTVASRLFAEEGLPVIGIPKTIDNDVVGTDVCFGFTTAVQIATDAIDRLHSTAESHDRVVVIEVMGRDAGWIALQSGIAGGATVILVPEQPFDINVVADLVRRRHARGRQASLVVVAEGATAVNGDFPLPEYGTDHIGRPKLGGISVPVAQEIERLTGFDTRVVQIGLVQRGGTPCAYDRVLCTRLGLDAVDAIVEKDFGKMLAVRSERIERVPLSIVNGKTRRIDVALYQQVADVFFG
ncbi:MAG: 6-phosphofructokinase [Actinobacteria bacterium]|nr:6-phosphofructokinase [Actinomycetota bacterium]